MHKLKSTRDKWNVTKTSDMICLMIGAVIQPLSCPCQVHLLKMLPLSASGFLMSTRRSGKVFRGSTTLSFFTGVPSAKIKTPTVMCSSVVDAAFTIGCLTLRGTNTFTLVSVTTPIVSAKFATRADGVCALFSHHPFNVLNQSSIALAVRRRSWRGGCEYDTTKSGKRLQLGENVPVRWGEPPSASNRQRAFSENYELVSSLQHNVLHPNFSKSQKPIPDDVSVRL